MSRPNYRRGYLRAGFRQAVALNWSGLSWHKQERRSLIEMKRA
jgi:hypothetical protein